MGNFVTLIVTVITKCKFYRFYNYNYILIIAKPISTNNDHLRMSTIQSNLSITIASLLRYIFCYLPTNVICPNFLVLYSSCCNDSFHDYQMYRNKEVLLYNVLYTMNLLRRCDNSKYGFIVIGKIQIYCLTNICINLRLK